MSAHSWGLITRYFLIGLILYFVSPFLFAIYVIGLILWKIFQLLVDEDNKDDEVNEVNNDDEEYSYSDDKKSSKKSKSYEYKFKTPKRKHNPNGSGVTYKRNKIGSTTYTTRFKNGKATYSGMSTRSGYGKKSSKKKFY
jgi:hypothetical protein